MYDFDNIDKKNFLDVLAYLLWDKDTDQEYIFWHIGLCKRLYNAIVQDFKSQLALKVAADDIRAINSECYDLGIILFMEKRLELIEERLIQRKEDYELGTKEPDCDYGTIALSNDQETAELTKVLIEYSVKLEKMVVKLRSRVNDLTPKDKPTPYPELHSGFYEVFHDYPAYIHYRFFFEPELD